MNEVLAVDAPEQPRAHFLDLAEGGALATKFSNRLFDQHSLGIVETLKRPSIEP